MICLKMLNIYILLVFIKRNLLDLLESVRDSLETNGLLYFAILVLEDITAVLLSC